jgi:RNA polymerase sigma factor (sigma-70 family)
MLVLIFKTEYITQIHYIMTSDKINELWLEYLETGNERIFNKFYDKLRLTLRKMLYGKGYRELTLLDEALNFTLIQLINRKDEFDKEQSKITTLAYTICKNHYIKLYRKRNRLAETDIEQFSFILEQPEDEVDIFEYPKYNRLTRHMLKLIQFEPFQYLRLHYIEGLKYTEIMEELDVPMSKVKNEILRQKKILKLCLEQPDPIKRLKQDLPVIVRIDDGEPVLFRSWCKENGIQYAYNKAKLIKGKKMPFKVEIIYH